MEQRIYHGKLTPADIARVLIAHFNRGNFRVQQYGTDDKLVIQIATYSQPLAGGQTALSVQLETFEDGVNVQIGNQALLGTAASLGITALFALRNPFNLLGRLDDVAQDIENLQLTQDVWQVIDSAARLAGANQQLSERLRRMVCEYCNTANPVGESNCIACGAPLGNVQPITCRRCGFIVTRTEKICPNCGQPLQ
ncbi:MAG: zinc ribbon domain-containing protein [Anaerolineaceae bacterium]